jgi:hypothetical protein
MLRHFSLSANASQIKYVLDYENYDVNGHYHKYSMSCFELTLEHWKAMVSRYKQQDKKKKGDISKNVSHTDNEYLIIIFVTYAIRGSLKGLYLHLIGLIIKSDIQRKR